MGCCQAKLASDCVGAQTSHTPGSLSESGAPVPQGDAKLAKLELAQEQVAAFQKQVWCTDLVPHRFP